MVYEWDDDKSEANLRKHGVAFTEVERFDWATSIEREDDRIDYGERRYVALGFVERVLHVLVFTERGATIRVISRRRATPAERSAYVQETARSRQR